MPQSSEQKTEASVNTQTTFQDIHQQPVSYTLTYKSVRRDTHRQCPHTITIPLCDLDMGVNQIITRVPMGGSCKIAIFGPCIDEWVEPENLGEGEYLRVEHGALLAVVGEKKSGVGMGNALNVLYLQARAQVAQWNEAVGIKE